MSTKTRAPSACAICYAMSGEGVRATTKTHGMIVCTQHGSELKHGTPLLAPGVEGLCACGKRIADDCYADDCRVHNETTGASGNAR